MSFFESRACPSRAARDGIPPTRQVWNPGRAGAFMSRIAPHLAIIEEIRLCRRINSDRTRLQFKINVWTCNVLISFCKLSHKKWVALNHFHRYEVTVFDRTYPN